MSENKIYGPDIYKRNEHGLLADTNYDFNEDGSVNWRSMIKDDFLYPNKGWFEARKKPVPNSVAGLKDNQLFIMLGGIKELAKLRGFKSVAFDTENVASGYVKATCRIVWSENYESNKADTVYEDVANASLDNTDAFCAKFLETIACNRAFVRCVRNFLNIHIVGADEIDKSKGADNSNTVEYDASSDAVMFPLTPSGSLQKALGENRGINSFEEFKALLRAFWANESYRPTVSGEIPDEDKEKEMSKEIKSWKSYDDIPAKECRKLIAICKNS